MANTKIVLNRQSDLILDNALITNPQGIVLTDISGVSEAVASINSATSADLSAESSAREAADLLLADDLASEGLYRTAAVSAEASIRYRDDQSLEALLLEDFGSLASLISSESSARAAAVDNEQSARVDGDQSLQNQIDFITSNTDAAAIDSLTEVVAAFQSADGDLNGAITNLANAATTDLSAEISTRLSGDVSLETELFSRHNSQQDFISSEISTEISTRVDGDQSLQNQIDFITNNTDAAAIDSLTEIVAAFQSADGDINGAITNLANAATTDLSAEASARISRDLELTQDLEATADALSSALSSEVSRAESAEASIAEELSSEVSYIMANTDLSSIDSFAEVVSDMSSEVSTRYSIDEAIKAGVNAALVEIKAEIVRHISNTNSFKLAEWVGDGIETVFTVMANGQAQVFLNGVLQSEGNDYTMTQQINEKGLNENTYTFLTVPDVGSVICVIGQSPELGNLNNFMDFTPLV